MGKSGHTIRAYREAQRPPLLLRELAARIGISKASLSRIENGKQELTLDLARRIAATTGVPLRELLPGVAREFATPEPPE
jgi:transcriptional regulator with XRE-family HTH domain